MAIFFFPKHKEKLDFSIHVNFPSSNTVIRVINYIQMCRSVVLTKGMRRKEEHISSFFKKLRIPSPPTPRRSTSFKKKTTIVIFF